MDLKTVFHIEREYDDTLKRLHATQLELTQAYETLNQPGYGYIASWLNKELYQARDELERDADRSIFSIWLALKRIWQANAKIELVKRFFRDMSVVEGELRRVTEEILNLTEEA